jgi:glycine oxidase
MKQYLIIGSGLIGRLLAWRLVLQGHYVDIISKDDFDGTDSAGYVAASMVSPATEAVHTEAMVKYIGLESLTLWPQWLAELPEPVDYIDNGTLVVAHAGDQAEMARFLRRAQHSLDTHDYIHLDSAGLTNTDSGLAENFDEALFFKQESAINNRQLFKVLANVLEASPLCRWQRGVEIASVSEAIIAANVLRFFQQDASDYEATLDCRGNGAYQDIDKLRGVRGEIIRVSAPDVNITHTVRLLHPRYPLYLAPRANNEYVLGATVIESDDRSEISVRSGLELMSALYSLHKGFAEARVLEMKAHCRPAMQDNMPVINKTTWGYQINGFYRHGYLFSPAMITDVIALLAGKHDEIKFKDYFKL